MAPRLSSNEVLKFEYSNHFITVDSTVKKNPLNQLELLEQDSKVAMKYCPKE